LIKISGGELRGRNHKPPPGLATRPTSAKVREALFAILGARVIQARAADLFAGSGALGLEALSRGAAWCLFVDQAPAVLKLLGQNVAALGLVGRAKVLGADLAAANAGRRLAQEGPFDLLLADPPYGRGLVAVTTALAASAAGAAGGGLLAREGWLVIEHSPRERPEAPPGLTLGDCRAYGQTELSFLFAS
jgi:16S rRNA (guanine966-N2)-methyltransferase